MTRRSFFGCVFLIGVLLLLPSSSSSASLTGDPPDAAPHGSRHIPAALSGSLVAFDPTPAGEACYRPQDQQTFCFQADTFSEDDDWVTVHDLYLRFPADWHVEDVYVHGDPACTTGANWGGFSWSYQVSPYEVRLNHPRNMYPVDECTAYYCFDVWTGSADGAAVESWYWYSEGGDAPHFPCSSDGYTPAGQPACDEALEPAAEIPACSWSAGAATTPTFTRWDCTWFDDGSGPSAYNQKVYCLGGNTSDTTMDASIWSYDPQGGGWADSGLDLPTGVSFYDANLLIDENYDPDGLAIYVVGGIDDTGAPVTAVQRFYPKTGIVEPVNTDVWPGQSGGNTVLPGACTSTPGEAKIYCFGGVQTVAEPYQTASTYEYDPTRPPGARWLLLAATLEQPRAHIITSVYEDTIYAMGGAIWLGDQALSSGEVEILKLEDLAAGWQPGGDLILPTSHGTSFDIDPSAFFGDPLAERVLLSAGMDIPGEVLSYFVNAGLWNQNWPDLLTPRYDHAGVYIPLCTLDPADGFPGLWVFGGSSGGDDPPYAGTEFYPMLCRQPVIEVQAPPLELTLLPDNLQRIPFEICNNGNATLSFALAEITTALPPRSFGPGSAAEIEQTDPPPPGAVLINFDDSSAPCTFAEAIALTGEYEDQGVLFSGPSEKNGGATLDECSGLSVSGYSSPNFLAFNPQATLFDGGIPTGPERITFTAGADYVQIDAGSVGSNFIVMTAYDAQDNYLGSDFLIIEPEMKTMSIDARGISYVIIDTPADNHVLDNLAYMPAANHIPWLDEKPSAGTLPFEQCQPAWVYFDSTDLETGVYTGSIRLASNDPATPEILLPVTMTIAVPAVEFIPPVLDVHALPTSTVGLPLDVCNNGSVPLNFALIEESSDPPGWDGLPTDSLVGVFKDANPYGVTDLEEFLDAQDIPYEIHGSNEFGTLDFHRFDMIVFSADQPQDFYDAYAFYAARFADYVEDGGFLNFIAHDAGNNGGLLKAPLPGGVIFTNSRFEFANIVDLDDHPVVANVPDPFFGEWASSGEFSRLPPEARIIAHGMDWGGPTIVEYPLGQGWVIAFSQALEFSHHLGWEGGPIMENTLLYGGGYVPAGIPWMELDGSLDITLPGDCSTITVTIRTAGLDTGTYEAVLQANTTDPDAAEVDIPVYLTVDWYRLFLPLTQK